MTWKKSLNIGKNWRKSLNAYIEIPKRSTVKYEIDEETGILMVDRFLHSAVHYPANYGFIPTTLADDGDPLDIMVLGDEVVPHCIIPCRPIGLLFMEDDGGIDEKIIAIPVKDPEFIEITTIGDLPKHQLKKIEEFFFTYKNLEPGKWAKIDRWGDHAEAMTTIEKYILSDKKT